MDRRREGVAIQSGTRDSASSIRHGWSWHVGLGVFTYGLGVMRRRASRTARGVRDGAFQLADARGHGLVGGDDIVMQGLLDLADGVLCGNGQKTKCLTEAGWRVVRIREDPLEPITELDVRVPLGSNPKNVVDLLLPRLVELDLIAAEDADAYLSRADLVAGADSLKAVRAIQAQRRAREAD